MSSKIQTCFRCDGVGEFYEFGEYLGDKIQCKGCEGKGSIPIEYKKCLKCNGKGKVFEFPHNMGNSYECSFCHDKGYTLNELKKCVQCEGEGKIYQFKQEKMGKEFKCEICNGNGYHTLERFKTIKFEDPKILSKKSEERLKANFQPNNAIQDMKSPETGKINKLMKSTLVFQGVEENYVQNEDAIPVGRGISQKNPLSRENLNQILNNQNNINNPNYNNFDQNLNSLNKQQTLGYSYNNPDYPQFSQIQANNVVNQQPNYQQRPRLVRKNVMTDDNYFEGTQNINNNNNDINYHFGNTNSLYNNIDGTNNTNKMYQQLNSVNFSNQYQNQLQQQNQFHGFQQQNSFSNPNSRPGVNGNGGNSYNFNGMPFSVGQNVGNNQNNQNQSNLHRIDTSSFLHKMAFSPEFSKMKPLEMPSGYKKNY
jgi:hypothetical protein